MSTEREFDSSLDTNFRVKAEFSQGQWQLVREDGVNWGSTGITAHRRVNGSGPKFGPHTLVSKDQAELYARHLAALWNAAVS